MSTMAISSKVLGSVKLSGEDAKSFERKFTHGRGSKAAGDTATNGRILAQSFAKKGSVEIRLKSDSKHPSLASKSLSSEKKLPLPASKTLSKTAGKR
jgi:hypothetical protein